MTEADLERRRVLGALLAGGGACALARLGISASLAQDAAAGPGPSVPAAEDLPASAQAPPDRKSTRLNSSHHG